MRKVLKTLMVFGGLALLVGLWSAARAQWPPVKDPMRMANERSAFRHSEAGTGTATATPEVIIVPTINLTREAQLRAALFTTPTPSPTSTLGPIPTRRPGPTATAYPTATLFPTPAATPSAAAPAGEIWFNIYDEQKQSRVLRRVPVDRDGKALAAGVEIPWPGISGSMYLSPDGHYWLIGIAGMSPGAGQTYVYDLTTGKTVEIPSPYGAGSIFYGWHPDSRHVLLATIEDRVAVVNVETLAATDLFPPDPQWGIYTWSAGFSPDGQRVAFAKKGGYGFRARPAGMPQFCLTRSAIFMAGRRTDAICCMGAVRARNGRLAGRRRSGQRGGLCGCTMRTEPTRATLRARGWCPTRIQSGLQTASGSRTQVGM